MNISTEHILQCNQTEPLSTSVRRIVDLMNENASERMTWLRITLPRTCHTDTVYQYRLSMFDYSCRSRKRCILSCLKRSHTSKERTSFSIVSDNPPNPQIRNVGMRKKEFRHIHDIISLIVFHEVVVLALVLQALRRPPPPRRFAPINH